MRAQSVTGIARPRTPSVGGCGRPSTAHRRPERLPWPCARGQRAASKGADTETEAGTEVDDVPPPPPGEVVAARQESVMASLDSATLACARYQVVLKKPLGLVLETDKHNNIFVAEIKRGGNAEREGSIGVGDVLVSTSAYVTTTEQQYGETWVQGGEKFIKLATRGETFDTVMAAIGSHKAHHTVVLEFQRCAPSAFA